VNFFFEQKKFGELNSLNPHMAWPSGPLSFNSTNPRDRGPVHVDGPQRAKWKSWWLRGNSLLGQGHS
jgi:hypothetical protein